MRPLFRLLSFTAMLAAVSGCYYDRESELYPQPACNLDTVKWSTTIRPIIALHCAYVGCHASGSPQAGIDLSTYKGVDSIALSGALIGSVSHQSNYTPMPYQQPKMPDCLITQIRIWVDAGAKED